MNQGVNEQMATRKHAEELAIDHMCDPCEWVPVPRVKGGKRPGESRERNTAIHHWIFLDIRRVIESDKAMPYYLRINPKRNYRQPEQDEQIGSFESSKMSDLERFLSSLVGDSPTSHALARLSDRPDPKTLKLFWMISCGHSLKDSLGLRGD